MPRKPRFILAGIPQQMKKPGQRAIVSNIRENIL